MDTIVIDVSDSENRLPEPVSLGESDDNEAILAVQQRQVEYATASHLTMPEDDIGVARGSRRAKVPTRGAYQ